LETSFQKCSALLRHLRLSDAHDIYKNVKDKEVSKWTATIPYPYPKDGAVKFIRHAQYHADKDKDLILGIEYDGRIIGVISLMHINKTHKRAELGYWLGKKFWGKGIMTESVRQILKIAFQKKKLHRIYAKVFQENLPSQKVLERCGFNLEGVHKDSVFKHGKWRDIMTYAKINHY